MYEELVQEFDAKKENNVQSELKELKIASYLQEVERLRHDQRQKDLYIASFKRELSNAVAAQGTSISTFSREREGVMRTT